MLRLNVGQFLKLSRWKAYNTLNVTTTSGQDASRHTYTELLGERLQFVTISLCQVPLLESALRCTCFRLLQHVIMLTQCLSPSPRPMF